MTPTFHLPATETPNMPKHRTLNMCVAWVHTRNRLTSNGLAHFSTGPPKATHLPPADHGDPEYSQTTHLEYLCSRVHTHNHSSRNCLTHFPTGLPKAAHPPSAGHGDPIPKQRNLNSCRAGEHTRNHSTIFCQTHFSTRPPETALAPPAGHGDP